MVRHILVLLTVFVLNGCQATSQYAGKTPLLINASAAQNMETYFASGVGSAFAIAPSGGVTGWTSCPYSRCVYTEGSADKHAITLCEKNTSTCKAFAINQEIVWEGPISLVGNNQTYYVVRLIENLSTGSRRTHSGTSTIAAGAQEGSLSIKVYDQRCVGDFDVLVKSWDLKCPNSRPIRGKIDRGVDSLFWGESDDGHYEISIARKGWPILEEKIRQHSATYSQNSVQTKAPAIPSHSNASPADNPIGASGAQKSVEKIRREAEVLSCTKTSLAREDKRKFCECTIDEVIKELGWSGVDRMSQSIPNGTISDADTKVMAEAALKCAKH